ncbi:MAG: hypothetical protein IKS43_07250 [Clostridia bacterium]|nr:hypothetical protein [Clostridia bacterium]
MKNSFVKTLSACLCLVMLLPICGCRNEETEALWDEAKYVRENARLNAVGVVDAVAYDGIIYYYVGGPYLYYAAVDGSEAGPLCSKPECTHDSPSCGAHTNIILNAQLMMYNGRLYWLEGDAGNYKLVSAVPGSNDRRVEQRYEPSFWRSHMGCYSTISNGMLYLAGTGLEIHDGEPKESAFIYVQDLGSGEMELVFCQSMDELYMETFVRRQGDTIYLALSGEAVKVLAFDMKTREVSETAEFDCNGTYYDSMTVEEDRIVFTGYESIGVLDLETGSLKEVFRGEGIFLLNDKAVLSVYDMTHCGCCDYDGNLIGEWCFADAGLTFPESTKYPLGCVDGKLFFLAEPDTGDDPNIGYLISCVPEENRFEVVQAIPRR